MSIKFINMKKNLLLMAMMVTFICFGGVLQASPFTMVAMYQDEPGKKMNFQGTLYENGEPVNGERKLTFSIDLENDDTWIEVHPTVQVVEGLYGIVLGSITPMPSNLFYEVNERTMTVTVGNTVLGTTKLLAPFALADNKNFNTGSFKLEVKSVNDTVALKSEIYGLGIGKYANAIFAAAKTDSANTSIYSEAVASETNDKTQRAILGRVFNDGSGWSIPVQGIAYANGGGVAYGIRGDVFGTGVGFSAAARGLNFISPSEDGNRFGGYFNTYTDREDETNVFTGSSTGVRGNGGGSITNYGLFGQAFSGGNENYGVYGSASEGLERNIGVYGEAFGPDSIQNWAGYFAGDTRIEGKLVADKVEFSLNTETAGDSIAFRSEIYGPGLQNGTNANAMIASARTDSTNTAIYSEAVANEGNESFQTGIAAQVHNDGSGWSTPVWGTAYANGGGVAYGIRGEVHGSGSGFSAAARGLNFIEPGQDGNRYGAFFNTYAGDNVTYTGTSYGARGAATGSMRNIGIFGNAWGADSTENWAGWFEGDTRVQGTLVAANWNGFEHGKLDLNEENAGRLSLFNSDWQQTVEISSNGSKAGRISLMDSLGQEMYKIEAQPDGNSYEETFSMLPDGNVTTVGQRWNGQRSWINMIGRNEDGSATGRAQMGFMGDSPNPQFALTDANFRRLVDITGDLNNGGRIGLEGPNSSNIWLGAKEWEDANLPYVGLRGAFTESNDNGDTWNPDLLNLEISRWDAEELGTARFVSSFGRKLNISAHGLSLQGIGDEDVLRIGSDDDGNGNRSSSIELLGTDGMNIHMGSKSWETNGHNLPFLSLQGSLKKTDGDGNEFDPWMVAASVNQWASGVQSGELTLEGSEDGYGIRMYGMADFEGDASNLQSQIAIENPNGSIYLNGNGTIDASGDMNAANFNQTSDARLKKDVSTLTSGLAIVNKLRGVRYAWKDENKSQNKIGFLAQEIEEVLPELVTTKKDGFKAVNYSEMTAVLVQAVKELSKQIEDLKEENDSLKAELSDVEDIEDRLALIEALLKTGQSEPKSNKND
jgi:endosialidase-like protein